jgi:hypothetical protein
MKTARKTKNDLLGEVCGIPRNTPDSWFQEQLDIRQSKWDKMHLIGKKYHLGSGDVIRERNGQMTEEYYNEQDQTLYAFPKRYNYPDMMSDVRDFFEYNGTIAITGEWNWKIDGKENYNKLLEWNRTFRTIKGTRKIKIL